MTQQEYEKLFKMKQNDWLDACDTVDKLSELLRNLQAHIKNSGSLNKEMWNIEVSKAGFTVELRVI